MRLDPLTGQLVPSSAAGGGATLPSTSNLLVGDGAGGAADSGVGITTSGSIKLGGDMQVIGHIANSTFKANLTLEEFYLECRTHQGQGIVGNGDLTLYALNDQTNDGQEMLRLQRHNSGERALFYCSEIKVRNIGDSAWSPVSCGSVTIGGGTPILKVLSATGALAFTNVAPSSSADLTMTLTGATTADSIEVGYQASPNAALLVTAWVSAADTATIRVTNVDPISAFTLSTTFRVTSTGF